MNFCPWRSDSLWLEALLCTAAGFRHQLNLYRNQHIQFWEFREPFLVVFISYYYNYSFLIFLLLFICLPFILFFHLHFILFIPIVLLKSSYFPLHVNYQSKVADTYWWDQLYEARCMQLWIKEKILVNN